MSILGAQSRYNGVERIVPALATVLALGVGSVALAILRYVRPRAGTWPPGHDS